MKPETKYLSTYGETEKELAREAYGRNEDMHSRGHEQYSREARRNDDMYQGGGKQWKPEDKQIMEEDGRPTHEINEIMPAVNAAIGYQIANRMDVSYRPRGGHADAYTAKLLSRVTKHVLDRTKYRYHETQAFSDGLIQQRGYLHVGMNYDDNDQGEIQITSLDPLDVIPDTDAKSYDPSTWGDIQVQRWMSEVDIEQFLGHKLAERIKEETSRWTRDNEDWGAEYGIERARFGSIYGRGRGWHQIGDIIRYRILDWQRYEYKKMLCVRFPTGDFRSIEGAPRETVQALLDAGLYVTKRRMRVVRRSICLPELCVHDEITPFSNFDIVPFFPYFRRGKTVGMVDNAISPQEITNKAISSFQDIVSSMANSGWFVPEGSLTNMTIDDFEERGAETGLVVEYNPNKGKPEKINAQNVPPGVMKLLEIGVNGVKSTTSMDESMQGIDSTDKSGVAIQSLQHAAQQRLAVSLDNLERTRCMVSERVLERIQYYYIGERLIRITESDKFGIERDSMLSVNKYQDGMILNDLTIGEYDVAITSQPINVTFDNSQFDQAERLRTMGIPIPNHVMIKLSSLADKEEIAAAMQESQGRADPEAEARAALIHAQAHKAKIEAVNKSVEAMFSSVRTAQIVATMPSTSALAEQLLKSAGFEDQDAAPLVPTVDPSQVQPPPENTNPLTPDNPDVGMNVGMTSTP